MPLVWIESKQSKLIGFQHWWCKFVRGFNPSQHCINSLVGPRQYSFNRDMPVNVEHEIPAKAGEILYFCGVATPWNWGNNMHLVGMAKPEATSKIRLYTGDMLIILGLEEIAFDAAAAAEKYSSLGDRYLTCRNFQFAAQAARDGLIPEVHGRHKNAAKSQQSPGVLFE